MNLPAPPRFYRWSVLFFVSLAMFGNYYVYDSMGPVFDLLSTQLGYTDQQKGLLYSAYSIAAVLVLLGGGYVIDLGLFFSYMLWKTERGPGSHGLETITSLS